jgi:aspartate kinase
MIVMKFGGTSVENAEAIRRVASIVRDRLDRAPVVVVSAMAGVTNALVRMADAAVEHDVDAAHLELNAIRLQHQNAAHELLSGDDLKSGLAEFEDGFRALETLVSGISALSELSPRSSDLVHSYGEVLSSVLVAAAFRSLGLDSAHVDSRLLIVTDSAHQCAQPLEAATQERLKSSLLPHLANSKIPVMGGFIGSTEDGVVTTLGRGGSDYTAAIVGAALGAEAIEIWTDVEGMLTTDPRLCSDAQRIHTISFDEAAELAYFGAKVLHPATLLPAVKSDIPVYVLNSRNPRSVGTCIRKHVPPSENDFRAIAAKKGSTVINVRAPRMLFASGFLRSLFEVLEKHRCPVDLVSTSEVSVSIVVDPSHDVAGIVPELRQMGDVEVEPGKAIICLVGNDIRGRVGIAASVFHVLASAGVNIHMISQGASEINISVVIDEDNVPLAVQQLHTRFFGHADAAKKPTAHVQNKAGSAESIQLGVAGDD